MPPEPRPGILDIKAYVGGEASAPGVERLIRLASNERQAHLGAQCADANSWYRIW